MSEHVITLVKPTGDPKGWSRGERIIMVDGERWGRTRVKFHGRRGPSYRFEQEGGDMIMRDPDCEETWKDYKQLIVHSASERREKQFINGQYRLPDGWKSTEDRVVDKIGELIAEGRLRPPAVVRAEREAKHVAYEARRTAAQQAEEKAFRVKAAEAIQANDLDSEMVTRVVEAMRWAQSQ